MSGMSIAKALLGGLVGLILGTVAGCSAVIQIYLHRFPLPPGHRAVGWDIRVFLHSAMFWLIVLVCTLGLAFLATRMGRHAT
jgi:hypothetical protein